MSSKIKDYDFDYTLFLAPAVTVGETEGAKS